MVAITKRNILKQTDGIFWDEVQKAVEGTDDGIIRNLHRQYGTANGCST